MSTGRLFQDGLNGSYMVCDLLPHLGTKIELTPHALKLENK